MARTKTVFYAWHDYGLMANWIGERLFCPNRKSAWGFVLFQRMSFAHSRRWAQNSDRLLHTWKDSVFCVYSCYKALFLAKKSFLFPLLYDFQFICQGAFVKIIAIGGAPDFPRKWECVWKRLRQELKWAKIFSCLAIVL